MSFQDNYTTTEKITADKALLIEDQTAEDKKTIISNDAFSTGEQIQLLVDTLDGAIRTLRIKI